MGSVTVCSISSIGSPLDLRIRREARKSKALLDTTTVLRFDSERERETEEKSNTIKTVPVMKSEAENVEDLSSWLKTMTHIDTCGRTIEQVEGIQIGVLPSTVSKNAERFDQMNVMDDEFYTYTGKESDKKDLRTWFV